MTTSLPLSATDGSVIGSGGSAHSSEPDLSALTYPSSDTVQSQSDSLAQGLLDMGYVWRLRVGGDKCVTGWVSV
jgi:hypothetical protein